MADCNPETNGELRFARSVAASCRVILDVGARTDDGLARLNPRATVHLFEPLPAHFAQLAAKVRGLPNVVLNNVALGDVTGPASMHPDSESIARRASSAAPPVVVDVVRLDAYCATHGIERIDFLKLDTEGHELHVLRGGLRLVRRATRIIQYEYGGTYRDAGTTLKQMHRLLGRGWHHYRIRPDGLEPVRRYRRALEDFEYANFVASRTPLEAASVARPGGRP